MTDSSTTYMAVCVRNGTELALGQLMEWEDIELPLVKPFTGEYPLLAGFYVEAPGGISVGPVPPGMRGIFICSHGKVPAPRFNQIVYGFNG